MDTGLQKGKVLYRERDQNPEKQSGERGQGGMCVCVYLINQWRWGKMVRAAIKYRNLWQLEKKYFGNRNLRPVGL